MTESELRSIIREQVEEAINEGFKEKMRNAIGTFSSYNGEDTGNPFKNFRNRFRAAKENYGEQAKWDNLEKYRGMITQMMQELNLSPDTTLGQLVGQKGRFGKIAGMQRGVNNRMNNNVNGNTQARWDNERLNNRWAKDKAKLNKKYGEKFINKQMNQPVNGQMGQP